MKVLVQVRPRPNGIIGARVRGALLEKLEPEHRPIESPLVIRLRFLFRRNGSTAPVPSFEGTDLLALARTVLDELAGLVYADARHIVALHVSKEFGNVEGVEISW